MQLHMLIRKLSIRIESSKTTSMEDVSTRELEKINNIEEVKIKTKKYMMYQDIYNCICQNKKQIKIYYPVCQTYSPTGDKNWFPKGGPTCRRQVVNPRHQTSQGQSVAKPETPLQNIQVELLDVTQRGPTYIKTVTYILQMSNNTIPPVQCHCIHSLTFWKKVLRAYTGPITKLLDDC